MPLWIVMPDFGQVAHERLGTPDRPDRDDAAIVRRAQLGSASAFDSLVRKRAPDLYRYLLSRLGNESDARDALQETIIDAWTSLPNLRSPESCWPWLVTIAKRKAQAMTRKHPRAVDFDLDLLPHADESTLEVWDAIVRLRPIHREILFLRYVLGLSEREAADVLGIRVGAVKNRGLAARRALDGVLHESS
jgi:RNA polymerase sigma factor (sigma-70 family)